MAAYVAIGPTLPPALSAMSLAAVNFCAIALAQLALRKGVAATVIPIQQLPIQAIPIILHVWLYRGSLGEAPEAALLGSGLVLLLSGSYALGPGKIQYSSVEPGSRIAIPSK